HRAGRGVAHDDGVGEDLAQTRVGLERLALDDPDGRGQAQCLGITRRRRFPLHEIVDGLPVAVVVGWDGVERHAGALDEPGSGMGGTAANGGPSARKLATDVPGAPGAYREMRSPLRIV